MPRTVTQVNVLHDYITGVMDRAGHHAANVQDICLAIAGAVVWRNDGDIRVLEVKGQMTNALWFQVGSNSYAISYNHDTDQIDVREHSLRGQTLRAFTNADSAADVRRYFATL